MRRTDTVHFGLMLAAFGLSYLLPFELVLLSYVVLGPAHYLTEISWLHNRGYFLPHRGIALGLFVVACAASFLASAFWFGVVVWTAFIVCALLAGARTALQGMVLVMAALVATAVLYNHGPGFAIIGILLPTLVHVSLFTFIFMVLGAIRSRSPAQFALAAGYVVAILAILLVPPSAQTAIPALAKLAHELVRQCAAGARPRARHAEPDARRAHHRAAVVRVHLSLPQLVHQS